MTAKPNGTGKRAGDRQTQEARRALVPELRRLVEDVVPAMLEDGAANRSDKVPTAWKQLADAMRAEVHAEASKDRLDAAGERDEPTPTEEERRGYRWSMKIGRVAVDDANMRRLRTLQAAETAVKMTRIPTDADVEDRVARVKDVEGIDPDKHRHYIKLDQPVLSSLLARSELAEVDPAFGTLDPLVVLEEFGDAKAKAATAARMAGTAASVRPGRSRVSPSCAAPSSMPRGPARRSMTRSTARGPTS